MLLRHNLLIGFLKLEHLCGLWVAVSSIEDRLGHDALQLGQVWILAWDRVQSLGVWGQRMLLLLLELLVELGS